jgi:hypothetical protein
LTVFGLTRADLWLDIRALAAGTLPHAEGLLLAMNAHNLDAMVACFAGGRGEDDPKGLRVAEFAAAVGVGADTSRFCEKTGLLLAGARTAAAYRTYVASAVDRLQLIWMTSRIQVQATPACLTAAPEEKIVHWRSRSRHLSDGAWQKSRIAAIQRPDVEEVAPGSCRLTDWPRR